MVMHARSGGSLQATGLMQGKIAHEAFVVMDTFPLSVEGTETRANANEQAYEYMVESVRRVLVQWRPSRERGGAVP